MLEGVVSCTEHMHALLFLESTIPGGPGDVAHFFAVASFGVQHPAAMGYTKDTMIGLRAAVADVLDGRRDLSDVRRAARFEAARAGRVTRRAGDAVPAWPIRRSPMLVTDVLAGGVERYGASVEHWARSIVETLHAIEPM